jgi:hypothetical protein
VRSALLLALIACSGRSEKPSAPPQPRPMIDAVVLVADAAIDALDAAVDASTPVATDEVWLKGSTHVHAKPSGDSAEPVEGVVRWYEDRGYDFIVLTDHNRVTSVPTPPRLIVIPGVELTHNRKDCEPPGDESRQCRIHINAIGVTARPDGKLEWTDYKERQRVALYEKAYATAKGIGASVIQINHPQYYWGMTPEVLIAIGKGAQLVEIANVQFAKWNQGDATHLSTEALWDAALGAGVSLWGVATDDAHDYDEPGKGRYPAGGGWVVVKAKRDAQAILTALATGRFYSSTGIELARAERVGDELVVEVAPGASGQHSIAYVENGRVVATTNGLSAKRVLPQTGYVRAVVTRDDGKQAWVQPVRR